MTHCSHLAALPLRSLMNSLSESELCSGLAAAYQMEFLSLFYGQAGSGPGLAPGPQGSVSRLAAPRW